MRYGWMIYHFDFFQDEWKFSGHIPARRKRRRCALVFLCASRTSEKNYFNIIFLYCFLCFGILFKGNFQFLDWQFEKISFEIPSMLLYRPTANCSIKTFILSKQLCLNIDLATKEF